MDSESFYSMHMLRNIEEFSAEDALRNHSSRSSLFTALWELSVLSHRLFTEFSPQDDERALRKATELLAAIDSRLRDLAAPALARKAATLLTTLIDDPGSATLEAEWRDFQIAMEDFNVKLAAARVRRVTMKQESFERLKDAMAGTGGGGGNEQVLQLVRELMQNFYSDTINSLLERIEELLLQQRPEAAREEMAQLADNLKRGTDSARLARSQASDTGLQHKAPPAEPAVLKKVLVVDDVPLMLSTVKAILQSHYQVYAAKDHHTALRILNAAPIDLVITDINMPGMDGITLTKVIRAMPNYGRIPIILLTGSADRDKVIASISAGGNDYLLKPVNGELLLQKIKKYLSDPGE